jgi:ATP-dependent DNA helicase RecG
MKTSIEQLNKWLSNQEGLNLEFKKAENSFSNTELYSYCSALSNEGGGKLIFGVEPKNHVVVGTKIFQGTYNSLSHEILTKLGIRVDVEEVTHPDGRVLIFHIPTHYIGKPIKSNGIYYMRAGESLVPMDERTLKQKLTQYEQDFSASIVKGLTISDLDDEAIKSLRNIIMIKGKKSLTDLDDRKLLDALDLTTRDGVTFAGLILLGKKEKISEILPPAEIIFEWRQDQKINHDFRKEWREPFLKVYDDIWLTISNRNTRIPIQEGLIQNEILAFNEKAIREALLNAVTHRDYSIVSQSVFIRANLHDLTVTSPGGFLPGITPENIIDKQASRNRRLADVLQKLGLVERSGQGMDQIFETTIREGKGRPDLSKSSTFEVVLKIPAQVKDKNFILFIEKVSQERQIIFSFEEIYELELLRENKVADNLKNKNKFLNLGIIEKIGKTSGTKYILSHKYYKYENKPGIYTRIKGLSREHKKKLILDHIEREKEASRRDFLDAFSELKPKDISNLLSELKKDSKIIRVGSDRSGLWKIKSGEVRSNQGNLEEKSQNNE